MRGVFLGKIFGIERVIKWKCISVRDPKNWLQIKLNIPFNNFNKEDKKISWFKILLGKPRKVQIEASAAVFPKKKNSF